MAIDSTKTIKVDTENLRQILSRRIASARRLVRLGNEAHFVCATVPIDCDFSLAFQLLHTGGALGRAWYWHARGDEGQPRPVYVAVGAAMHVEAVGTDRFDRLRSIWLASKERIVASASDTVRFFFGFSFADVPSPTPWEKWPSAMMTLPEFVFRFEENKTVTVTVRLDEDSVDDDVCETALMDFQSVLDASRIRNERLFHEDGSPVMPTTHRYANSSLSTAKSSFTAMVSQTAEDIRHGRFAKAVMARQEYLENVNVDDVSQALLAIRQSYPYSTGFAVSHRDEYFLGASPEILAKVQAGEVLVDCLAGTTRRGEDDAQDELAARQLLQSTKDQSEHEVVVQAIERMTADLATEVVRDLNRQILRLPNVSHLYSRVRGRLKDEVTLFDAAKVLHPTPAIAGYPRDVAIRVISDREPFHRGWYAGGVGVITPGGDGEISVALRSALATSKGTFLYAGAGIMGDSDPEAEWNETELKLRPMRMAFGRGEHGGSLA